MKKHKRSGGFWKNFWYGFVITIIIMISVLGSIGGMAYAEQNTKLTGFGAQEVTGIYRDETGIAINLFGREIHIP